jgi:hypothetical protein
MKKKEIPSCTTIPEFLDVPKYQWDTRKSDGGRDSGDGWEYGDQCKLLGLFLLGNNLSGLCKRFVNRSPRAIITELDKMHKQYGTVPVESRGKEYWLARLRNKKEPRDSFATNDHWVNPFDMRGVTVRENEKWWFRSRLQYKKPIGEFDGESWERVVEESGRSLEEAMVVYQDLEKSEGFGLT